MKKTFEMIKDKLSFIKIHRSLIVNLKYVKKIERDLGNSYKWVLILQNDERLPISLLSKAELILRFKIKYNH